MRTLLAAGVAFYLLGFTPPLVPAHSQPGDGQLQRLITTPSDSRDSSQAPRDAEKAPAPNPGSAPADAISLPQIADRAQELNHLLREITSGLTPKTDLLSANQAAEAQTAEIRRRALEAKDLMADNPTPMDLEDEQRYWRSLSEEYRTRRKVLAALAEKLQQQIQLLDTQLPQWETTWDRISGSSDINAVVEQVRNNLEAIRVTRSQVDEQLKLVLTIQNQVSQQDQQIWDVLVSVRQLREQELGHILEPDSPPLWKGREHSEADQTVASVFHRSLDRCFSTAREFLRRHKAGALGFLAFYLLALFCVRRLRSYVDERQRIGISVNVLPVQRAFSVALLLALLLTLQYAGSVPIAITFVVHLLYLIPVLRLLVPMIDRGLRSPLYVVTIAYVVTGVYLVIQLPRPLKRELHALIVLAALAGFGWILRLARTRPSLRGRSTLMVRIAIRMCSLLLVVSLVANIIGYASLSQLLSLPSLVGPFLAAALYCATRVLVPLVSTVLHLPGLKTLPDVTVVGIEHVAKRLLNLTAFLFWTIAILRLLTVYEQAKSGASTFLQHPIGFGKVSFTLAGTFTVLAILLAGYVAANALTFFLQNFVLARWRLKRGLPFAISKVTYYACLVLVGLAALSAAGVELNKFTVLTGALGVGLGFGLQNIVNNFVSGLILIFERPIHVGDVVDVGGLEGTVRRIGARSSTVVTFQGAEVIVPNSNLLSNQLINWTLSSPWRRIDIPLRVAYGTDPERLIKLLVGVAESNPGVLLQRPPVAFFRGFGESALNFELRFWSAQQDTWLQLQSDVTVGVARALREAGVEIPFPQRDLHVRSIDLVAAGALGQGSQDNSGTLAREHNVRT